MYNIIVTHYFIIISHREKLLVLVPICNEILIKLFNLLFRENYFVQSSRCILQG